MTPGAAQNTGVSAVLACGSALVSAAVMHALITGSVTVTDTQSLEAADATAGPIAIVFDEQSDFDAVMRLARAKHPAGLVAVLATGHTLVKSMLCSIGAVVLTANARPEDVRGAVVRAATGLAHLTPREAEVYKRVHLGQSRGSIANELGISVETVRKHVQNINRKLGSVQTPSPEPAARELL
jgi:DNA-binding CsgD family transcriptional regulator